MSGIVKDATLLPFPYHGSFDHVLTKYQELRDLQRKVEKKTDSESGEVPFCRYHTSSDEESITEPYLY